MIGWINDAKAGVSIYQAAQAFGHVASRGAVRGCPSCGAQRRSGSDRRPPISTDGRAWRCWACNHGGSVLDYVCWALTQQPYDRTHSPAVRGWFQGEDVERMPPPKWEPIDSKAYPPLDTIEAIWEGAIRVNGSEDVWRWLEGRGISPHRIDDYTLAKAIPSNPRPALAGWYKSGHRLLIPLYDAEGVMRSFKARQVWAQATGPKSLSPAGFKGGGLVMANQLGVMVLRTGEIPRWWGDVPFLVRVVEGGPGFLAAACSYSDGNEHAPPVYGMGSGLWTQAIADRIPDGSRVLIETDKTDKDGTGDKYAAHITATLGARCKTRRQ